MTWKKNDLKDQISKKLLRKDTILEKSNCFCSTERKNPNSGALILELKIFRINIDFLENKSINIRLNFNNFHSFFIEKNKYPLCSVFKIFSITENSVFDLEKNIKRNVQTFCLIKIKNEIIEKEENFEKIPEKTEINLENYNKNEKNLSNELMNPMNLFAANKQLKNQQEKEKYIIEDSKKNMKFTIDLFIPKVLFI